MRNRYVLAAEASIAVFWADIFYSPLREGREGIEYLARVVAITITNMVVYVICSITSITKGTHHFVLLF